MKYAEKEFKSMVTNRENIKKELEKEDIFMVDRLKEFCDLAQIHIHDVVTISGSTDDWKTDIAIDIVNNALKHYSVLYFNLDNSDSDIYTRLIQNYNNSSVLNEENKEKYYEYLESVDNSLIMSKENNLDKITAMIQEISDTLNEPLVVIIDTLSYIENDSNDSMKKTTNKLRHLTLNNDIIMFNMCKCFEDARSFEEYSTHVIFWGKKYCRDEKQDRNYIEFQKNIHNYDLTYKPMKFDVDKEEYIPFEQQSKKVYITFADKKAYEEAEKGLLEILSASDGHDEVYIIASKQQIMKSLGKGKMVTANKTLIDTLKIKYGEKNVKVR